MLMMLAACTSSFSSTEMNDIPVSALKPGTSGVDVDFIFKQVQQEVQKTLPGAVFQGMVYSGSCQSLPQLEGRLVFILVEERGTFLNRQVLRAIATVHIIQQRMDLSFWDVSDQHPSTHINKFIGDDGIKETIAKAQIQVNELGLCKDDITISQIKEGWDVRCGPLENFIQLCRFEIINGQIKEKRE